MEVGSLVTMDNFCGGPPGALRCESALVVVAELSHVEQVQVDTHRYADRDIYECTLMCKCGLFKEYADRLGFVDEDR